MSPKRSHYGTTVPPKSMPYRFPTDITKSLVWSFKKLDVSHARWGLRDKEQLSENLFEKLLSFEGLTLQEILSASGGRRRGTNSHWEDIDKLCHDAQIRWNELHLDEYDQVLSLRLQGRHRLYGVLDGNTFMIIWYDTEHEIYPIDR